MIFQAPLGIKQTDSKLIDRSVNQAAAGNDPGGIIQDHMSQRSRSPEQEHLNPIVFLNIRQAANPYAQVHGSHGDTGPLLD
jgi:hypothetical protein